MPPSLTSTAAAFLLSAAVTACATPLARRLAMRRGHYSMPVRDRWHRTPVPFLGGLGIIAGFASGLSLVEQWSAIVPLLICSGLMALLGIVDDFLRLRPSMKLVVQILVAGLLLILVTAPRITGSAIVDQLVAFTWIVGITNAFNLLDNMDGLAAGVAAISGIGLLALVLSGGGDALMVPLAAFIGAATAFLVYNFAPASIFMGDGGSFFLGSFLATASLLLPRTVDASIVRVGLVPLLVLLVPIFDTAFVTYTRKRAGRSAMVGGRDHTSHRLVALGVTERVAVLTLYALAAGGVLLAVAMAQFAAGPVLVITLLFAMTVFAVAIVLGYTAAPSSDGTAPEQAPLLSDIAQRRRIYELLADTVLLAVAYYAAFRIRFQGPDFDVFFPPFVRSLPIVIGLQLAGLYFSGKYRQVWRNVSAAELFALIRGLALGISGSVLFVLFVFRFERFSRGVFVIDALVAWFFLVAARAITSGIDSYLRKARVRGARVVVYGAGRGGTLLVREVLQNPDAGLMPVGFIDDDPRKRRLRVEGIPVLGDRSSLADVIGRHGVSEVVISIRDLEAGRLEELMDECSRLGVSLRRMRFSIDEIRTPRLIRRQGGRDENG